MNNKISICLSAHLITLFERYKFQQMIRNSHSQESNRLSETHRTHNMEIKLTWRWYNKKSEPANHNNRQWRFSASVWSVACRSCNSICQALLFLSRQEQKEKQTEAYRRKNWFEFRASERACPLCCFQSVSVFNHMAVCLCGFECVLHPLSHK